MFFRIAFVLMPTLISHREKGGYNFTGGVCNRLTLLHPASAVTLGGFLKGH